MFSDRPEFLAQTHYLLESRACKERLEGAASSEPSGLRAFVDAGYLSLCTNLACGRVLRRPERSLQRHPFHP